MKKVKYLLLLLTGLAACGKIPGTGGLATLKGKLYVYDYNAFGDLVDSGYVAGERVYISYGDNLTADDDVRSGQDGSFAFEWLQPGKYKVWAVSDCDTCPLKQSISSQEAEITARRQVVTLPDLKVKL